MSFTWENDRRLVSVTRNGSSAYYTYDAGGVRRTKTVGNTSLTYEYTDGKLISQTDGTNVWWFYYDADGTRLAMEYNGEKYYYVYNIVGDVKGMYDSDGNIVAEYGYSGYGEHGYILNGAGQSVKDDPTHIANINPFRFKGYYFDAETEFYYLNTRYYDPYVCRFLNADAYISTGQGPLGYNMFAYCMNNPIMYSDDSGTIAVVDDMLYVIAAVIIVAAVGCVAATTIRPNSGSDSIGRGVGGFFDDFKNRMINDFPGLNTETGIGAAPYVKENDRDKDIVKESTKDKPKKTNYWEAKIIDKQVVGVRSLTYSEARQCVDSGRDLLCINKSAAIAIVKFYPSQTCDEVHGEGYLHHYHLSTAHQNHIWYYGE